MHVFEFDAQKSQANEKRHGIDFLTAQQLWKDPYLIEIQTKSDDESRFLIVGFMEKKHWSAVITYREGKIRLISVRRARKTEVELYESREI